MPSLFFTPPANKMSVAIQWFENPAFDAPELKSPQPCIHGAGCVYTKKTADGKVVPGVCGFVHPGEEGKGRALFPARTIRFQHPDGEHVVDQPACVRLIGGALYYERMRMRMPWQAFCAEKGIPFTPNTPGVYREPVKRVPIGTSRVDATKNEQRQREIVGKLVSLSAELSSLMGPAPLSAVATADQSWPVLPVPHAGVEAEVIAASAHLGVVLPRSCACEGIWHACGEGTYDLDECDDDICNECGKLVELCLERGDHSEAHRWEAEQATW